MMALPCAAVISGTESLLCIQLIRTGRAGAASASMNRPSAQLRFSEGQLTVFMIVEQNYFQMLQLNSMLKTFKCFYYSKED